MPRTLLVVDDSANIREAARLALAGEDWSVIAASSAEQALDALRTRRPDAVLCDVALGDEDGYDLVRRIRKNPESAGLPVVIMGAKVSPAASMAAGASATMPKPFSADELVETLRATLDAPSFGPEPETFAGASPLSLTLKELGGEALDTPSEEVEIIDLSGDEQYAELELLEGLEPIPPGPEPFRLEREDAWDTLSLGEKAHPGGGLDLNLDEFLAEPKPEEVLGRPRASSEGEPPLETVPGSEPAFDLETEDLLAPLRTAKPSEQREEELSPDSLGYDRASAREPDLAFEEPRGPFAFLSRDETSLSGPEEAYGADPLESDPLGRRGAAGAEALSGAVAAAAEKAVREALAQALSAERLAPAVEAMIEKVVWEVVPALAERLIREAIDKIRGEPPAG